MASRGLIAVALSLAGLLVGAAPAIAQAGINVAPSSVPAGGTVTVSGSVGNGCMHGDQVTLISGAFGNAHEFAGVPAVFATSDSAGNFSVGAPIPANRSPGSYSVSARCGGGRFGDAQINVVAAGTSSGTLPRTGFAPWLLAGLGLALALAGFTVRRGLAGARP
jgi:hypothetical protein